MAYTERPHIDLNSERSEESITAVRKKLSRKNGFICREINGTDDYGVDINVQLINNGEVIALEFPVQVKSSSQFRSEIIDNQSFKTLLFKTSRLGFLADYNSPLSLIIIYDESEKCLYYDYVYQIVSRIKIIRKSNKWKSNEKVTIYIPVKNKLKKNNITDIHQKGINVHRSQSLLIADHGVNYGFDQAINAGNSGTIEFLKANAFKLLFENKHSELICHLEKLSVKDSRKSEVIFLSAISYTAIGNIIESNYYFSLYHKYKHAFSESEKEVLKFEEYKHLRHIGEISVKDSLQYLHTLRKSGFSWYNLIVIDSNILSDEVQIALESRQVNIDLAYKAEKIIDELDSRAIKNLADLHWEYWVICNQIYVATTLLKCLKEVLFDFLYEKYLLLSIKVHIQTPSSVKRYEEIMRLFERVNSIRLSALKYIDENPNDYLKARVHLLHSTIISSAIPPYVILNSKNKFNNDQYIQRLQNGINSALRSFDLFSNMKLLPQACKAILQAKDIHDIAKKYTSVEIDSDVDNRIKNEVEKLEESGFLCGNCRYKSRAINNNENQQPVNIVEEISLAIINNFEIRKRRLPIIKKIVKASMKFYQVCNDENLELASSPSVFNNSDMLEEPTFAIFSKNREELVFTSDSIEEIIQYLKHH